MPVHVQKREGGEVLGCSVAVGGPARFLSTRPAASSGTCEP